MAVGAFAGCSTDTQSGGDGGGEGGGGDGGDGGGSDGGSVPSSVKDYLSDANNYDGIVDKTGTDNPTVKVGAADGLSFGPAAVRVSAGTTVTWEWTGQGGGHNVVHKGGDFDSGSPVAEKGATFEHTFEQSGNYLYFCEPHKTVGMKGAVVVG